MKRLMLTVFIFAVSVVCLLFLRKNLKSEQLGGSRPPAVLIASKSVCDEVLKQRKTPSPVTKFEGKPVEVNFSRYPEAKTYFTVITQQASEGPNFAGHFTYAEWGCGTDCLGYAVVDSTTGDIVKYQDGVIYASFPSYDINSRLLVINPKEGLDHYKGMKLENIVEKDEFYLGLSRDYYELIEERGSSAWLNLLCTENVFDGVYSTESEPANKSY